MKVSLKIISNKITFHLNPLDKKLLFYMKVKIATKFKQYDIQNLAYQALSDYESEKRIIKDEEFLARMDKDVESRLIKEDKIMSIITIKKGKLKEEERLKTFNRLISDANRRLEDINKTKEITKQEEYERILREKSKKRYKEKDWEEIYEERGEGEEGGEGD